MQMKEKMGDSKHSHPYSSSFLSPRHWLHNYENGGAISALLWRLMECVSLKKMFPYVCQWVIMETKQTMFEGVFSFMKTSRIDTVRTNNLPSFLTHLSAHFQAAQFFFYDCRSESCKMVQALKIQGKIIVWRRTGSVCQSSEGANVFNYIHIILQLD